ncbi:IclR family transcriptional regulator [Conexibacter sp. CPCC 206217]|uniref:IclR family transcriptional regulator n=1 Tax=Conexibacter sp. CPCC 206217 TaxID=3064574 RepID=UPI00271596A3|nr:IclR family transcriptional regulator [Conexibacter sp. CPCC 206217]MDO8212285.1 IclR family transcriptional regulator [Conexibacter sp. CPCC 206217]
MPTAKRSPPTEEPRPRGSQLDRGLRTLELLAAQPRSAAEIGATLGVNRSTGLRLLQDLESLGYVRRNLRTKRYEVVAERFLSLASSDHHKDWHETINPILERIRDEVGESTLLATPATGVMVYVTFFGSTQTVAVRENLGTVRPMHASAIGKAWLSSLPEARLDAALGEIDYAGGTEHAPRGPLELRARVQEARERGFATDYEESLPGVSCVAVPAWIGRTPVGSVAVSGPAVRMGEDVLERTGALLIDAFAPLRDDSAS